ncbi:hypothetical protein Lesp02_01030 [Lentzea sp. NBRC 105346]|uniref:universal stress protein n=1 Tax=Lentzea sp. NBRC 105346 TaxID=3032205 RepID=UPI00249FE39E|nr:universal stress protein [Lentzea sp. NBRC 105346]GLZ27913.1 hypothetical protein Lesp02_01030 [Lentzea sp. NBRC 105346]
MSTNGNPIVVGIDGTPASERALRWALDEAVTRNCPLHVVNAWAHEPLTEWSEMDEQEARRKSEALMEEALRAAAVGRLEFPEIVRRSIRGPAAEVLEKVSQDAAMLVVASHTGHRLRKIVLGSTSTHCVRHASAPVVVIPVNDRAHAEAAR